MDWMTSRLHKDIRELGILLRSTPPKGCFEEVLRKLSKENENVGDAIIDLLTSLPPNEAIEKVKHWRTIT